MSNISKNKFAHLKSLALLSLVMLFFLTSPSLAAKKNDFVIYKGKKYDASYFKQITGTVNGQAAPGVQEVKINGKIVPVDQNYYFKAKTTLKTNQKYLTIETRYRGLRFIKKYLVIRHPKAKKTFTIKVTEKEFEKIVKPPPPKPKPVVKKPVKRRVIKKKPLPKVVIEKLPSKIIKEKPPVTTTTQPQPVKKPPTWQKVRVWFANLLSRFKVPAKGPAAVPRKEVREIVRQEATLIIEKDAQKIIEEETQKYLVKEISSEELNKILQKKAPEILEKEVKKILARDVPTGAGLRIVRRELKQLVDSEAPKIIKREVTLLLQQKVLDQKTIKLIELRIARLLNKDKLWQIAREAARKEGIKSVDKTVLRTMLENTIQTEIRNFIAKEAPSLIEGEFQKIVKEAASRKAVKKASQEAQALKPAKFISVEGQQPYDLIIEINRDKILLIKLEKGKFHGYLYIKEKKEWFPVQDISAQELKDLLEQGKLPASLL